MNLPEEDKEPLAVRIKYYTTLTLGLVACLSCFIFMFLIPFVLDPSISTLVANFDPEPVICMTIRSIERFGLKNCVWSSCKIGCTTDQTNCTRIYVNYLVKPFTEYDNTSEYEAEFIRSGKITRNWTVMAVPVFVNIKACGYAPSVNCTNFNYYYSQQGAIFSCYYSRTDASLVITSYSLSDAINSLIMAIIIPNVVTGVSLGILSYWWYPGCQKRTCQYQVPPDQEAVIPNEEDGSDDEESMSEHGSNSERKDGSVAVSIKSAEKICIAGDKSPISDSSHTNM